MDSSRVAPDLRVYLKIKIKSLAEESRIIRKEELRRPGPARSGLHLHRVGVVRKEARATLLAYGFLRGRTLEQLETRSRTRPRWKDVLRMVEQYGPRDGGLQARFEHWKEGK